MDAGSFAMGAITGGPVIAIGVLSFAIVLVRVILSSPVLLKAMEGLTTSWPPEAKQFLTLLGKLAIEVSDDVPADEKPAGTDPVAPPSPFSPVRPTPATLNTGGSTVLTTDMSGSGSVSWGGSESVKTGGNG